MFLLIFVVVIVLSKDGSAAELTRREWKIDGITREALVHVPADAATCAVPLVFAFHGHGGNMTNADRMFGVEKLWPEAMGVYMQGLNTPGRLTDPQGKVPGWQRDVGDQGDRDLKFFDAVLTSLEHDYKIDTKRIYATGHSNGGAFTYLLWQTRGEKFAAFAPSAAASAAVFNTVPLPARKGANAASDPKKVTTAANVHFLPKPLFHLGGDNDPLVKPEWQKLTIDGARKINQCGDPKPWPQDTNCTLYPSKINAPVVTYIHHSKHQFPSACREMVVKFFKEQTQ